MKRRLIYTLHVLEKIGLPLVAASARKDTPRSREVDVVKSLLDETVATTRTIESVFELEKNFPASQNLKLWVAAIASQITAKSFENRAIDEDTARDVPQLISLLNALQAYADQFALPTQEGDDLTLKSEFDAPPDLANHSTAPEPEPLDMYLTYISAFGEIITAVSEFSFGQPEKSLIQSISNELTKRTFIIRDQLFGRLHIASQNLAAEQAIFRVLAALYAETHREETRNVMRMSERARLENGSQLTIDLVWRAFDRKCTLLEALVEGLLPTRAQNNIQNQVEKPAEPVPLEQSVEQSVEHSVEQPTAPPPEPEKAQDPIESPLSFFTKTQKK